ncbi:zinc finger protein pita-like [Ochlerotatus camptorhynchus]|uniref:zinc finger protein pita-like n=1 Tax=Ochlerotatus camptorhynchus TaxID=644619 RepID=UPI0031DEDC71
MIPASLLVSNPTMGKLAQELAERKVCRICLIESEKLIDDLNDQQWNMILTTCFAISTVIAERLPKFVCEACCDFLEKCREFKQMCKKTELLLVSYPLTGNWPERVEVPNWLRPVQKRQLQQEGEDAVSAKKVRTTSDETTVVMQCDRNKSPIGTIRVRTNEALTLQSPTISSEMQTQFSVNQEHSNSNTQTVIQYCQNQQAQNSYSTLQPYSQYKPSPVYVVTNQNTSSCPLLQQQLQQTSYHPPPINSLQYLTNSLTQQVPYQQQQQQQPQFQQITPQQLVTQQPVQAVPLQQPSKQPVATTTAYRPIQPSTAVQCTTCSYVFASQNHLTQHMRKHLGNAEYHCGCGQQFFQLAQFVHHLKQHTNWCGLCGEQFQADWELNGHLDQHSLVGLSQACDFCPLVFIDQPSRLRHVRRKHSDEVRQLMSMNPSRHGQ